MGGRGVGDARGERQQRRGPPSRRIELALAALHFRWTAAGQRLPTGWHLRSGKVCDRHSAAGARRAIAGASGGRGWRVRGAAIRLSCPCARHLGRAAGVYGEGGRHGRRHGRLHVQRRRLPPGASGRGALVRRRALARASDRDVGWRGTRLRRACRATSEGEQEGRQRQVALRAARGRAGVSLVSGGAARHTRPLSRAPTCLVVLVPRDERTRTRNLIQLPLPASRVPLLRPH
mmetsp:Transcript_54327/g.125130  ORF Transcript_54327/g.125130 Transcript_54327/m.125130 type:complete len:233 (-) Transcript_54327:121-819(-)